jgi:hypothetical protein
VYSCLLWNQPRYSSMDEQIKETWGLVGRWKGKEGGGNKKE